MGLIATGTPDRASRDVLPGGVLDLLAARHRDARFHRGEPHHASRCAACPVIHQGLLVDNYSTRDPNMESDISFRLCYRCHERSSILADKSFSEHRSHLLDPEKRTSCYTCHNSHGSRDNPHLIEFNPVVVSPNKKGMLRYYSQGGFRGECYLSCHGADHDPGRYCPPGAGCDPGEVSKGLAGDRRRQPQNPFPRRSPFDTLPLPFPPQPSPP